MDYITLQDIKKQYNTTDQATIKANIRRLMNEHNTKHKDITELLNISKHTSHSYTNKTNPNKPEIYNLLILSEYWNEDITELFRDY
jgi:uncharacterized protein with NAD-binding domain and iron-sulfur cluster